MVSNQISLKPSSIARVLGAVAFLLVLASTGGQLTAYLTGHYHVFGLVPLFYVDVEQNIPTFFSTFLLLFGALLLAIITVLERNRTASHVSHWAILSFGFLLMAADEAVSFHERLIEPTRKLLGDAKLGVFNFAWVIPGIALILVLALFFVRFLLRLPAKTRLTFVMAAILYIGGSIGFELIGGGYAELHGPHNLTYSMIATVEESLEMAGAIIFIWALLVYIADNHKEVRFRFDGNAERNSRVSGCVASVGQALEEKHENPEKMNPPFQTGCRNSASRRKNTDFRFFFGAKCRFSRMNDYLNVRNFVRASTPDAIP